MNRLKIVNVLRRSSAFMRRLGLRPPTRLGKRLLGMAVKELTATVDGLTLSAPSADAGFLYRVTVRKYESTSTDLFKQAIKPGMVVLDIGANVGLYTLFAARQVGDEGKVYAFEPDPRNFRYLVRNITDNGMDQRAAAVSKAVSDRPSTASFFMHCGARQSSLFATNDASKSVEVECITLDAFLDEATTVDVVKMDIEGAEIRALKGMEQIIRRSIDNLTMIVECNPGALRATGACGQDLIDQLTALGLDVKIIDEKGGRLLPVGPDIESVGYVNLYCRGRPHRPASTTEAGR